jgi:hypothetical protein
MVRRLLSLGLVVATLVFAPSIGANAGSRQSTVCNADLTATIDPGLNLVVRDQTLKGNGTLSGCVGGGVTGPLRVVRG